MQVGTATAVFEISNMSADWTKPLREDSQRKIQFVNPSREWNRSCTPEHAMTDDFEQADR